MAEGKYRVGFSEGGGVYIGRNIRSDYHRHHLYALILSFSKPFELSTHGNPPNKYEAVFIPKDWKYKLTTSEDDWTVFLHIDPYSPAGLHLNPREPKVYPFFRRDFQQAISQAESWLHQDRIEESCIEPFILDISRSLRSFCSFRELDDRIIKTIKFIRESDREKISLQQAAAQIFLSPSRFSHLFKEETDITFKGFIRHIKLVKSLKAMSDQLSLTDASFLGGFSDQPHFTKAFKHSFGIKPSSSKHS